MEVMARFEVRICVATGIQSNIRNAEDAENAKRNMGFFCAFCASLCVPLRSVVHCAKYATHARPAGRRMRQRRQRREPRGPGRWRSARRARCAPVRRPACARCNTPAALLRVACSAWVIEDAADGHHRHARHAHPPGQVVQALRHPGMAFGQRGLTGPQADIPRRQTARGKAPQAVAADAQSQAGGGQLGAAGGAQGQQTSWAQVDRDDGVHRPPPVHAARQRSLTTSVAPACRQAASASQLRAQHRRARRRRVARVS